MAALPATLADLTTAWLTETLHEGGVLNEAQVVGYDSQVLGEGIGFVGQLARVRPQYDREEPEAPASLIAKFPSPIPQNRGFGVIAGLYETEIRFYNELAGSVQARTARCYFGRFDPEPASSRLVARILPRLPARVTMALLDPLTKAAARTSRRYALLIEDLDGKRIGDQVAGCSVEDARTALQALARFHAGMWNSPDLERPWLRRIDADTTLVHGLFKRTWPRFKDRYGSMIANMDDIGHWLEQHGPAILHRFAAEPRTLLHGDYRLDNLFFDPERPHDPEAVTIIDWQGIRIGNPMVDVAYFVRPNVAPEHCDEAAEESLVRAYHDALVNYGVSGYAWDEARNDYTLAQAWLAMQGAFLLGALDLSHERGVELLDRAVERSGPSLSRLDLAAIKL